MTGLRLILTLIIFLHTDRKIRGEHIRETSHVKEHY